MEDTNFENDNSLNVEEETIEETQQEEIQIDEEKEALKQELEKLKATNQRLYARVKKPLSKVEKPQDEFIQRINNLELIEKKRQFGYENGLSPAETDAIFKINPNPTKEDLENPFIKGGIDALRRKNRVEENTPRPSISTVKIEGKSFSEMDSSERAANWDKIKQSIGKK